MRSALSRLSDYDRLAKIVLLISPRHKFSEPYPPITPRGFRARGTSRMPARQRQMASLNVMKILRFNLFDEIRMGPYIKFSII